jgi:hypothetical protein
MNNEERKELISNLIEKKLDDDSIFEEVALAMDSYEGSLNDSRCFPMCELDEILGEKKPSEVVEMLTSDFDKEDDYFYFSIYGLESTDDPVSIYRDEIDYSDMVDWLETYGLRNISVNDDEFSELVEMLCNESYDEEDMTDEEFKEALQDIGIDTDELVEFADDDEDYEPADIDSDMGYDPYMGMITDEV